MEIAIKNVTKKLSGNSVLEDINLEFTGGNIYGLIGKNGSGKTMLMRVISGLIIPTEGEIVIDGKVLGKDMSFPESIGILIESPGFIPGYTGFQNLKFLAQIKGVLSDDDILKTLEAVGLDPEDKKTFRKYSLGMKQKLGIAAAVMENPRILILDEPFNALDEETTDKIREIIRSVKSQERIVLLACHDREEIENLCDITVAMQAGKVTKVTERGSHAG